MGIRLQFLNFPFLDIVLFTYMLPVKCLNNLVSVFCTPPFGIPFKVFTPYVLKNFVLISDLNLLMANIDLCEFVQTL